MKTSIRRTPQEWIRLRQIELRRIEKLGGKSKVSPPKLFLVAERPVGLAQQLEFTFGGPTKV
jgi:hypothetical protein